MVRCMQCRLSRPVTAHAKSCARSLASQLRTVLQQLFWALNNSKESCLLHSHSCFSTLIMSESIPRSSLLEWKEPKSAQWHSEDFSRIFQMPCISVSVMPRNLGCWLTHNLHVPGSAVGSLTWPAYCLCVAQTPRSFLVGPNSPSVGMPQYVHSGLKPWWHSLLSRSSSSQ